jgi:hypothetical protein
MTSDIGNVQRILLHLARKAAYCSEPFSGLAISMSLYGLKSMDGDNDAIKKLLAILASKIEESDEMINERDLQMIVTGLRNKKSAEISRILILITSKISKENFFYKMKLDEYYSEERPHSS